MKKKSMKRIVAAVLAISMVFEMIVTGIAVSEPVDVAAATSKKVTTTNIYQLAPEYLNNDAYSHYFALCAEQMKAGIDDVSDSQEGFAVFWESVKSGADIITRNVLASFGQGRDYEDEFKYNLVKEILFEYIQTDTFANEKIENIDKTFSAVKTVSKTSKEWSAANYKAELKAANNYLTDSEIEEIVDTYVEGWESVTEIADIVTEGADVAQFVTTALMMNEIENKALDDLEGIFAEYDMDLVTAIAEIKAEKNDFLKYFRNNYLNDKVRETIVKNLKYISGYSTVSLAIKVMDLIIKNTIKPVSVSDIVNATLAYGYALEADAAVSGFITAMMRKKIAGETVSDEYIESFKTAYNFMIAAYIVGMDKSSACVKNKTYIKDSLAQLKEPLGSSINFATYLDACVECANKAVDEGTLVISGDAAIKKTPDGTVIDENYDSTESITAKLAAIKEKYPTGTVWGEKFDGASQCFGFAKLVFYNLYGNHLGTTYQYDNMYQYNPTSTAYLVGQVSGSNVTSETVKNLMASAKIGDIIQGYGMGGYQRGQHTMIFLGLTSNGIEIYDCNAHLNGDTRDCVINQWTMSYDTLALYYGTGSSTSGNGLSVYRAVNYNEIYGDGTNMFYDDSVNFVINNGVLTKYNGWQSYVTIPDTVTAIGDYAFKNNTSMMSVEIPDTVTSIGSEAFDGCKNLVSVNIPDSVETIGSCAFYNCTSLATAYLPKNEKYETVASSLFSDCTRLKGIVIPDSVKEIKREAFYECTALNSVVLSKSLETLGENAFYNCDSLTQIEIPKSLKECDLYGPFSDCSNLKNISFEAGTERIVDNLLDRCDGIESVVIPDTVTSIGDRAFSYCTALTSVTISDSVKSIGVRAFSNCTVLNSVVLSKDLETLGKEAFCNCDSLTQIEIPKNLKNCIGYYYFGGPFSDCSNLKNISFEAGTVRIAEDLLSCCDGIESVIIPDTVTEIEDGAFSNCNNLTEVTIPDTVTIIGVSAFYNCTALTSVTIPDSVTEIEGGAFSNCTALTSVTIPDSVTSIENDAFSECTALNSVVLSKNLEKLGPDAFYNCDGLTQIEIPKSLKECDRDVRYFGPFTDCSNLKNISFEAGAVRIADNLLSRCDGIESVIIPDTVTSIGDYAFLQCTALTSVTIPDSVTSIGDSAFYSCTALTSVMIPDSVTSIEREAFQNCSALTKVRLSDNITTISNSLFYNCEKLSELKLPKNLNRVESSAFYNCDALTEIEFPYGTTYIAENVLQDAGELEKVVIPNTVTYLGSGAFYDCISLQEVVWGSGITNINDRTFYGCTALPKITIPETVTEIGSEVFRNCVKLYDVSIPESVTSIPLDAFSYPKKTTIYGYKDSYAQSYALQKEIKFVEVEKKEENLDENVAVEYDDFETPDNATFVTGKLAESDAQYQSIADALMEKNITTAYEAYNIKLVDANNEEVQPTGELQIKMALPEGYNAAAAKVYRVEEDDTFTDMNAVYEEGKLVFSTKYLTTYLVAQDELKEKSDCIFGDANSDSKIDSKDVVMMKKYLAAIKVDIDLAACDVNADGKFDSKDVVKTMKKLAGYDVVLGEK